MIENLEVECWALDNNLGKYILPRLLYFKNWCVRYGVPTHLESDEWEEILDEMVWAFTFIVNDYPTTTGFVVADYEFISGEKTAEGLIPMTINKIFIEGKTEEDFEIAYQKDLANKARCQKDLDLFAKYYMALWV